MKQLFFDIAVLFATSSHAASGCEQYKDSSQKEMGESAIQAIITGKTAQARELISCGLDVNYFDGEGHSILMWSERADSEFYQFLLSFPNIDIEHRANDGMSALLYAISKADLLEKAKLLLKRNADIFAMNDSGTNALIFAVDSGNLDNVKLVIDSMWMCNDPNDMKLCSENILFRNLEGINAIDEAKKNGFAEITDYLNSIVAKVEP